jgi:hypothetical protein
MNDHAFIAAAPLDMSVLQCGQTFTTGLSVFSEHSESKALRRGDARATLIEWRDFENKQVRNGARLTKKHLVYEIHGD